MCEIPAIQFSYYPMNLELLYLIPLHFGNDIVPKLIHFMFALLTAWLIYRYLGKRLGTRWALFGGVFFLSLPIIVKLSITVYVDLGLLFFSTASIISLLKWIESRFQIKFLISAAICCGLALGTKYNALIILFLLSIFIPFIYITQISRSACLEKPKVKASSINRQLKALGFGAIFILGALIIFSPWMIRNYFWKGNPIYPIFNSMINAKKTVAAANLELNNSQGDNDHELSASPKAATRWSPFAIRKILYNESWWEIALIPVRIFFQGRDDNPKYFDGELSPFLFFLPFFAFFRLKNDSQELKIEKKIFVFFTVLYIFYAFLQTDMRIRYITPIIPPLVILSVLGLHRIFSSAGNRVTNAPGWFIPGSILLLSAIMLSLNARYVIKQFNHVQPLKYLSGKVDRDTYIAGYRPEYEVIRYANQQLPPSAKILALFLGNRGYYSDRELNFGDNVFKDIVKTADSSEVIASKIQKMGFTHMLVRYDLFNRWSNVQFSDKEKEMLIKFFDINLTLLFSKSGYGLFKIL